jgi:hypothetical protein
MRRLESVASTMSGLQHRHSPQVGTTVRPAPGDPRVTRLPAVAREIFNNPPGSLPCNSGSVRRTMLKALERERRR